MGRGELPLDRSEVRRIARMAKSFALVDGKMYKRVVSGILQRCVPIPQGHELLRDIHAGVCGHHAAPRTLVGNVFRQGFYWPTAVADASEIVRTCEGFQFYARKSNLPAHVLQTIPVTWPFVVWGLDIVGPLRKAPEGYTHLVVAIDKFSKWVEVRPITNLRAEQAVTFFTDIVYRFGVPNSIITDNGSQFTGRKFLEFCDKFHIRVDWAAVAHPQTNGQVERANGMILQGLKPRIFDWLNKSGRKWLQGYQRSYGASGPPQAGPPGSPRSSWSMARRPSSPWTWSTGRPEFGATTEVPTSEPARTRWTNWMRRAPWP
jgi:transposase InsO family protein